MACLAESRRLYNEMIEQVQSHYAATGEFLFKYALCARFKVRGGEPVPACTLQALADRLDKALRRFLERRSQGKPAGFPRFKSPNRWHTIQLRQWSKDVYLREGRLKVPAKLGKSIKLKQDRPLEGEPKTAHLKLRADGHWYVLVVCDVGEAPPTRTGGAAVGLDVGLKKFLADSVGNTVENPRYYRRSRKKLRRVQRRTCRRQKGSKRRKKAARQRKDFLHKVARKYTENYATIFVEGLNVAGMVKNHHLASSIHDAGWSKFIEILEHKAESAGARVVKVSARFTTQECNRCHELVPKPLSVRIHLCPQCGYAEDRDVNAAKNNLVARTGPSERNVTGCCERAPRSRPL
jgi:putative transposase